MEKNNPQIKYVLAINTELQKKNDQNIQNFLNKYKHYEEYPELKINTGKDYDSIISHKSTIPDLVIYNKVFNKNDCFIEANKKENNYFPRQCFFIKFEEKEKQQSKGDDHFQQKTKFEDITKKEENDDSDSSFYEEEQESKKQIQIQNKKNEENKFSEKEEFSIDSDDEAEEEEEDENNKEEININEYENGKSENISKMNDYSEVDNNTIFSNNNSMYKDIELLPNNYNIDRKNTLKTQDLFNQSKLNYIDNSVKYEDMYSSFDSKIYNSIKNLVENNNDGNSYLGGNSSNIQKNNMNIINNSSNFPDTKNNKTQNMFLEQNDLLYKIETKNKLNKNNSNDNAVKELKENIIKLIIFDPQGNIIEKKKDINEVFEYLTENFILKDKKLDNYDLYIVNEDKKVDIKLFYMDIFNFLRKIKDNIKIN